MQCIENKKNTLDAAMISCRSTCSALDLPLSVIYKICMKKRDVKLKKVKHNKLMLIALVKNHEQRWAREYFNLPNYTESCYCAHFTIFNFLGIIPYVNLKNKQCACKSSLIATKGVT